VFGTGRCSTKTCPLWRVLTRSCVMRAGTRRFGADDPFLRGRPCAVSAVVSAHRPGPLHHAESRRSRWRTGGLLEPHVQRLFVHRCGQRVIPAYTRDGLPQCEHGDGTRARASRRAGLARPAGGKLDRARRRFGEAYQLRHDRLRDLAATARIRQVATPTTKQRRVSAHWGDPNPQCAARDLRFRRSAAGRSKTLSNEFRVVWSVR
jgi:hypothetical protein